MLNSFSKLPVGVRRMYIHPVPQRTHFMCVCNSGLPVQPLDRNRAGRSDRCNPVPSAIPTYLHNPFDYRVYASFLFSGSACCVRVPLSTTREREQCRGVSSLQRWVWLMEQVMSIIEK
jgi:hypothetical protein